MVEMIRVSREEMFATFNAILLKHGFDGATSMTCAEIFTNNSVDGVYTHGVNRFPRFVSNVDTGHVKPLAKAVPVHTFGGLQQWDGKFGPGPSNALLATDAAIDLAATYGIGCVALGNSNHWMRGGTYGWHAAKKGFVFIGWTNTIGNMPAWGAIDSRLGNNPLVMAIPFQNEAIVLDMAMSQFSFGAMELAQMKNEAFSVHGGYDQTGELTKDPGRILESRRPLPIGYWKGAGLALLLDILATILSAGWSTADISRQEVEYGLSQVFVAIDLRQLSNSSQIPKVIEQIIDDYRQSVPQKKGSPIVYPGERILRSREENLEKGIPVIKTLWDKIVQL